jgi:hypothetical protein
VPTFLVILRQSGPEWRPGRPLDEQPGWEGHAAYMDRLVEEGFIVLGGPVGDDRRVAEVVEAASAAKVRERLRRDPWSGSHLVVESVDRWTVRLNGTDRSLR